MTVTHSHTGEDTAGAASGMLPNQKHTSTMMMTRWRNEEELISSAVIEQPWRGIITYIIHVYCVWIVEPLLAFVSLIFFDPLPVVGSGPPTWSVPVWSETAPAARLSSCRPLLVTQIKCCGYLSVNEQQVGRHQSQVTAQIGINKGGLQRCKGKFISTDCLFTASIK